MSGAEHPSARPRSNSKFSFKSDKSGSVKNTKPKIDLKETAEEKRRSHFTLTKKANPNAAINEAQPIAAQLEESTLVSLRSVQHTDSNGNPIAEPDLSNPTRPRWERPLDTIRSFERNIDAEYKRRSGVTRPDSSPDTANGFASRRSSYYGGYDQNNSPSRYSQMGGYYGARARDSYADNAYGSPPSMMPGASRNRFAQRVQSDMLHRYNNGHVYNGSRDTVTTGVSNGSQSDPYSTDPSSENSSIDKPHPVPRPDYDEQYGYSSSGRGPGFQNPIMEESVYRNGDNGHRQANRAGPSGNDGYLRQNPGGARPPVSAHVAPQAAAPNKPIKLGGDGSSQPLTASSGNTGPGLQHTSSQRKGWFKRKFNKG